LSYIIGAGTLRLSDRKNSTWRLRIARPGPEVRNENTARMKGNRTTLKLSVMI